MAPERLNQAINKLPQDTQCWAELRYGQNLLTDSDIHNPGTLVNFHQRERVAFHEEGHASLARALGWTVLLETVVPDGSSLGMTKAAPNSSKTPDQLILDAIAISAGGEAAEEMLGVSDHSGCGFDRGKQRYLASIFLLITGSRGSVDSVISGQKSRARSFLGSIGLYTHQQNSMTLLRACA